MTEPRTYTCANCGETFEEGWTKEEAEAERQREFPGVPKEDCVLLCDDCYQLCMAWAKKEGRV